LAEGGGDPSRDGDVGGGVGGRDGGDGRRRRVHGVADGRVHVLTDLGGGQGAGVDPELGQRALEELAPRAGGAAAEHAAGREDGAGDVLAGGQGAVDVQAEGGAVVGAGQVRPGVEREGTGAAHPLIAAGGRREVGGGGGAVAGVELVDLAAAEFL